jgi:hypothetical protein
MQGRVYDPTTRRFLTPDPLITDPAASQTHNRYSYVTNNPATLTDPTGNQPDDNDIHLGPSELTGHILPLPGPNATIKDWFAWAKDRISSQPAGDAPASDDDTRSAPSQRGKGEALWTEDEVRHLFGDTLLYTSPESEAAALQRRRAKVAAEVADLQRREDEMSRQFVLLLIGLAVPALAEALVAEVGAGLLAEAGATEAGLPAAEAGLPAAEGGLPAAESGIEGAAPAAAEEDIPQLIFRTGARTENALTDPTGISFRSSASSSTSPEFPQRFRLGDKIWSVNTNQLPEGSVVVDNIPPGHVSVFASPDAINAAVVPSGPGNFLEQVGFKGLGQGSYRIPK